MWILTIHSPWSEPRDFILKAGKTTLGRHPGNDIIINDDSASRLHAEFDYDVTGNLVTLLDLGSTNGTYVNRERIANTVRLRSEDQVRIGQHRLALTYRDNTLVGYTGRLAGTQPLSRDLVLHAVDQHALVLYEVANRLNTILDLDMALAEVAQLVQTSSGADRCEVVPVYQFNRLDDLEIPAALAHQAVEQRSIVAIPDVEAQEPPPKTSTVRIRSVLCVPGVVGDEVYVLCYAYRAGDAPRPFEDHAVHLAVAVCHQAALTVQRELLLERTRHLERLASTDSLTGLNNRRHFLELAEQEFLRARRYKRPLAVLMLDVSDFKHFNHRYGHAVGDLLLRAVATSCRENLREPHLVARYGGDEFVVMLLECNQETGQLVANRLRDKTAALAIDTPAGILRVRLDAGCASLTPECPDLAALIDLAIADAAAAKQAAQAATYHPNS